MTIIDTLGDTNPTDALSVETRLVHTGVDPSTQHGAVSPAVYRASTIIFPSVARLAQAEKNRFEEIRYGRLGTPTTRALESAMIEIENGAHGAMVLPSGLAAIAVSMLALVQSGDHVLITDSVYGPTRHFCKTVLKRFGVTSTFFDPRLGAAIYELFTDRTSLVFLESPGSLTFEVQDIPAVSEIAHAHGAKVLLDATWATPLYCAGLRLGADVSIHAATKYLSGHSDTVLGIIVTGDAQTDGRIREGWADLGQTAGPDECFLTLRGLRTLAVRMYRHNESGLKVARWLESQPDVQRVLHPGLASDPGHALWCRDFTGASGLFGVELKPRSCEAVAHFLDGLRHFGLGASWGGHESLIRPSDPKKERSLANWDLSGPMLRIHVGLEDPNDLIADLAAGLERLRACPHGGVP